MRKSFRKTAQRNSKRVQKYKRRVPRYVKPVRGSRISWQRYSNSVQRHSEPVPLSGA